jgi:RNA polymerase sigma factor (sigma-70 family)
MQSTGCAAHYPTPTALIEKYRRMAGQIISHFISPYRYCEADIMDAEQEAALAILEAPKTHQPERASLTTWVYWKIVAAIRYFVRHRFGTNRRAVRFRPIGRSKDFGMFGIQMDRRPHHDIGPDRIVRTTGVNPPSLSGQADRAISLEDMLKVVPSPRTREAIRLKWAYGLSSAEVGRIQGCSESNVNNRIAGERARLRRHLAHYLPDAD